MKVLLRNVRTWVKREIVFAFLGSKFWHWFGFNIMPILKTNADSKFPKFKFQELYESVKVGDILVSTDYRRATTVLIPGEWSHAGIVVAKGAGKIEVVEMNHHGFNKTDFFKFCEQAERVGILRVVDERWNIEEFLNNVWKYEGTEYNFSLYAQEKIDPRRKSPKVPKVLYCSQLVTLADENNILEVNWEDTAGIGIPFISPNGLANGKNIMLVKDSGKVD